MLGFEQFYNKKIAILGYGREGKSSLQFFLNIGVLAENITLLDSGEIVPPTTAIATVSGPKYLDNLEKYDSIIKTPGISLYNTKLSPYKEKITTQAQIFFDYYQGKIIAISGTKGKSTTATLTYQTLKAAGKNVQLIGNIGNPVLDYLNVQDPHKQQEEIVVFEISSYMLDGLQKKNYISILLNIYADHLDWHAGFENYKNAKINIVSGSKYLLIRDEIIEKYPEIKENFSDYDLRLFGHQGKYSFVQRDFLIDDKKLFDDQSILLKGEHNMLNISAVLGVCDIMHINPSILKEVLVSFHGLPHRMENLGIYGGIIWVDDAISTTPESTIQAIKTFGSAIDTIFLGGTDRGYVFDDLIKTIISYGIENIVLFPDSGERIFKSITENNKGKIRIFQTNDMKQAVQFAYKYTQKGKICLLSTASPSYSLWRDFEEKGGLFIQHIKEGA